MVFFSLYVHWADLSDASEDSTKIVVGPDAINFLPGAQILVTYSSTTFVTIRIFLIVFVLR